MTAPVPAGDGIGGLCDRLEELAKVATDGPWHTEDGWDRGMASVWAPAACILTSDTRADNAALIVAAVNALEPLIAAARERDRLRAAVLGLADQWACIAEQAMHADVRELTGAAAASLRAAVAAAAGEK